MKRHQFTLNERGKIHKANNYKCAYCGKEADAVIWDLAYEFRTYLSNDDIQEVIKEVNKVGKVYRDLELFMCFEIDHIIPLDKGGSNEPDNIVLACRSCNRSKGVKVEMV